MKDALTFFLVLMISLGFILQSCKKENKNEQEYLTQKKSEVEKSPANLKAN